MAGKIDRNDGLAEDGAWRHDYNTVRPHSGLGYLTPEELSSEARTMSAQHSR
jgi:Integrase core domain